MSGNVTIVTLGVADVAQSTRFYEALGFRKSSASEPAITFLTSGAVIVALHPRLRGSRCLRSSGA